MNRQYYVDRQICRLIVEAQIASDAGKGIRRLNVCGSKAADLGYAGKDGYIRRALQMLDGNRPGAVRYCVKVEADQNGYPSVLVYFDINLEGQRLQVSFHNPLWNAKKTLGPWLNKGRKTHWALKGHNDTRRDGLDSADVCQILIDTFKL